MSDANRRQVAVGAAEVYDSLFVRALFGRFAEAVAEAAQIQAADQVIDVACGSGALTRAVRSRTSGRVVGIDLNPAMLAVARRHGGVIEYVEGDGQDLPFSTGEFNVATCQFGVMFYPDPAKGLAELARGRPPRNCCGLGFHRAVRRLPRHAGTVPGQTRRGCGEVIGRSVRHGEGMDAGSPPR